MNDTIKLGVIILNWNGLTLLQKFLPGVLKFTSSPLVEVIIADNGSTDGSVAWIESEFPEIRILKFEKNYGFAEGYNRAIERTRFPFTLLLNSDVEVKEGWWQPLLKFMEDNPDVGAAQPKIKSYYDSQYFEYAGAAGGFLDNLGYPYCRGRLLDRIEKDEGQYDGKPADICWASGAALIVKTDLYLSLGGLDKLFFAHMEEIDLCCRILGAGYRVCAVPDSEVLHVGGATLRQGNPKKTYLNFRNNLLLLYKNLDSSCRGRIIFLRRLADTAAFFMFILKLDFANAGAVIKAHLDYRKMKKNYTKISGKLKSFPGPSRSILIDRYIFNKKS